MSNSSPYYWEGLIILLCVACLAEQFVLEKVEVEYITMPGWKTSIAHAKSISDLPPNAKSYVEKLWELIGVQSEKI